MEPVGDIIKLQEKEIKPPVAVFMKQEVEWGGEEGEESFLMHAEDFDAGKDGSSVSLGGISPTTDFSSEKSMTLGQSLCTCTRYLCEEQDEAMNPTLLNARGQLPKHHKCEKCSADNTSIDSVENGTNCKFFTMRKTSTQRTREYRERKRLNVIMPKRPPKTAAERAREFRERQRALQKAAAAGDFIIEPKIKISTSPIIMPKTSTQRSRECRERKRRNRPPKPPPKSAAQRVKEFRERQEALKNATTSDVVKFSTTFCTS